MARVTTTTKHEKLISGENFKIKENVESHIYLRPEMVSHIENSTDMEIWHLRLLVR